ncbi:MAG: AraC family transcriptional regulator [Phycisphaerales bacterium]
MLRTGSLTQQTVLNPPGTTTLWADQLGLWRVIVARYPPGEQLGTHAHPHASFHLTLRGTSAERYWRYDRSKRPGTTQYYGADVDHKTEFGPRGAVVLHALRTGGPQPRTEPLAEPAQTPLLRVLRAVTAGDTSSLLEAEAWCEELEASVTPVRPRSSAVMPRWLDRVRDRIASEPDRSLSLSELADEEQLHPSHLARAFRQRFGCSVGSFARRCRLQTAAARLIESDDPISSIALAAGFCDQSHFGRAFSQLFGATPARFRSELGHRRGEAGDQHPLL